MLCFPPPAPLRMISPPAGGSSDPGRDTCLWGRLQYRSPHGCRRAGGPEGEGQLPALPLAVCERVVSLGEKRRGGAGLLGRGAVGARAAPQGMAEGWGRGG